MKSSVLQRFAAVAFRSVYLDLARAAGAPTDAPLAVVVSRVGGAVQRETDLLGNTHLDEVSIEARKLGVQRGDTIAAARAKTQALRVCVVPVEAARATLTRIAELALAFGPVVSFDLETSTVFVDVTGCTHLFGGERPLGLELTRRIEALGHPCRVAIAGAARVAAAVARFAASQHIGPLVVQHGRDADAMRVLPIQSLRLDPALTTWLARLGLHKVGDLQRLPRESLGTRLGEQASRVMSLIDGTDRTPLDAHHPEVTPEEQLDLEYGITDGHALLFVAKTLCERIAARLGGRHLAAHRLDLDLTLDHAMLPPGAPTMERIPIVIPSPIARANDLFGVLRARLDGYPVSAPIRVVTLRAHDLASTRREQLHLFTPRAKAESALPQLVAELVTSLGPSHVGTLTLGDTWNPEGRSVLVPWRGVSSGGDDVPSVRTEEPTRRLPTPLLFDPSQASTVRRLERHAATAWWRTPFTAQDYVAAWDATARATAWVEIDLVTNTWRIRGWMD